jgi:hypothetical protein
MALTVKNFEEFFYPKNGDEPMMMMRRIANQKVRL